MGGHRRAAMVSACLVALLLCACSTAPLTGRHQLDLVPHSELEQMSFSQYREFLSANKVSSNAEETAMVRRVGSRIAKAVEAYLAAHGQSDRLKGYAWEFNLIDSPEVNAWCMPGGKVVVYTGILPVTRDETGLAVVLGHEISHAVANHGGERLSQGLLVKLGGIALSEALTSQPAATQELAMEAFGIGSNVGVLLPFSRVQETEADHLGLIFMAMAGYDPRSAVAFWERMEAAAAGKSKPPELLSTHPADATRIADIKKFMPEALQYYKPDAAR